MTTTSKHPDFLSLFADDVRRRMTERDYERGELLFRRGDPPKYIFWIVAGEARLVRHSPAGMEVVFQRSRAGFLAEASLDQPAYHCDGVAVMKTRVLAIPIADFRAGLSVEKIRTTWLLHMSNQLRRVRAHAERLALRSARDRIIHYIECEGRHGELLLTQTRKSWASEMGLTHEALYRALRVMEQSGLVAISGQRISLLQK